MIDLRSDTVTRPSDAMRAVMAKVPVGDMQYGDDPSLNALEARVAETLGKEASLWLPSGTMAGQVALRVLTRPGDDVLAGTEAHSVWHEAGGSAANVGVQFTGIGANGAFTADDVRRHAKPRNQPVLPFASTTLVEGRKPNLHVSAAIATATARKAQYIRTRRQDDLFYFKLVSDYLAQFGSASRKEINDLLWEKLSEGLNPS